MRFQQLSAPADYYDQGIRKNLIQRVYHRLRFKRVLKELGKVGGDLLDIGCAGGTLTEKIADQTNGEVWGVDIDPVCIGYARKKRPHVQFLKAKAEKLPFPEASFSVVTCIEVLEHIQKPGKALGEFYRVLKKNGRLLILIPSNSWFFRLFWFFWTKNKGRVWRGTHLNCFCQDEMEKMLAEKKFKLKNKKSFHLGLLLFFEAEKVE